MVRLFHTPTSRDRRRYRYIGSIDLGPPEDLVPTSVLDSSENDIWIEGHQPWQPSPHLFRRLHEDPAWWHDAIDPEDDVLRNFIQDCRVTCSRSEMKQYLRQRDIVIVADGSFHPIHRIGTAGVVMETSEGMELARGYYRAPGLPEDHSAYRSELAGVLLGLQLFRCILKDCNVTPRSCTVTHVIPASCTVACDNISCVDKALWCDHPPSIQHQHFDLLWAIHKCRKKISIPVSGKHVYGHQSIEDCAKDQLARMNDTAHCLAKAFLQYYIQYGHDCITQEVPSQQWSIWLEGRKIVRNVRSSVLYFISQKELFQHLVDEGQIHQLDVEKIDWHAIARAAGKNTHQDALFWTKLSSGYLPTAQCLHMYNEEESNMCPCCENQIDTICHLLSCLHPFSRQHRDKYVAKLEKWAAEATSDPNIINTICAVLRAGHDTSFLSAVPNDADNLLREAAIEQDAIGHRIFIVVESLVNGQKQIHAT